MLARGETEGTFQLNGAGMTRYLKELKPSFRQRFVSIALDYMPPEREVAVRVAADLWS